MVHGVNAILLHLRFLIHNSTANGIYFKPKVYFMSENMLKGLPVFTKAYACLIEE